MGLTARFFTFDSREGIGMQNQFKHIVSTCVFGVFLSFFVGMCVFSYCNPAAVSESERRPLAQFPEKITWEGVIDKIHTGVRGLFHRASSVCIRDTVEE